ncbi:MAG: ECF transporter S component [Bacillota bacterium]|nr:ECF transporter S component [Bacillota bacterium]
MKLRKLILTALFIALSYIGANIKVMDSIAFDSMAGFLGAIILGPFYGAAIGAVGHILTALLSGFPLTLPVHLVVMVDMGITMAAFGSIYRYFSKKGQGVLGVILSFLAGVLINGPIATLTVYPLLVVSMGKAAVFAMIPMLTLVSALNVIIALVLYPLIRKAIKVELN